MQPISTQGLQQRPQQQLPQQQFPQQLQQPRPFQQMQPVQLGSAPRPIQQQIGIASAVSTVGQQASLSQSGAAGAAGALFLAGAPRPGFGAPVTSAIPLQQIQQPFTPSMGHAASGAIGIGAGLQQRPLSSTAGVVTAPLGSSTSAKPALISSSIAAGGATSLQPLGVPSIRPAISQPGSLAQQQQQPTMLGGSSSSTTTANPSSTTGPALSSGLGSTRPSFQQIQPGTLSSSSPAVPGQLSSVGSLAGQSSSVRPNGLSTAGLSNMHISANTQPTAASATPTATPIMTPSLGTSTPNNTPRIPSAMPVLSTTSLPNPAAGGIAPRLNSNMPSSTQQSGNQTFPSTILSSTASSGTQPAATTASAAPFTSGQFPPSSSSGNLFGQPPQQSATSTGSSGSSLTPVMAATGTLRTQQQQIQGQMQGLTASGTNASMLPGSQFQKPSGPPTMGSVPFPSAANSLQQPSLMKTSANTSMGPPLGPSSSASSSSSSSTISPPPVPMAAFLSQGPPTSQGGPPSSSAALSQQQQQAPQSRFGAGPPLQQQQQQQQQPISSFPSAPPTSSGFGGPPTSSGSGSGGPPRTAGPPMSTSAGPPMFQQQQQQQQQHQSGPPVSQGGPPQGMHPQSGPPQGMQYQTQQQMGPPMPNGPPMPGGPSANSGPGGLVSPPKSVGGSSATSTTSSSSSSAPRIDPTQIPRPRYTNPASPVRYNTTDHLMNTPPFAWSDFIAEDSGSCNPRFVRSTLGHVPASKEVLRETKLPLAVIVTPLAKLEAGERETMVVDFGEEGPPRCGRCRGYVNKFSRWNTSDGGRSWSCNLCGLVNETPQWYQCHNGVDQYGDRNDKHERPELMFGSVEFTAPSSYLVEGRNPTPLSVAFIIDVSLPALTSGLLQAASTAILSAIPALEQSSGGQARVGIIVYDSEIHFFDMKSKKGDGSISQATVCDVNEAFCPLSLSQWTGSLSEPGTRPQLELLLSRLPSLFQANVTRPKQSVSGAALKAAVEGLGDSGGRIVMFQAQLPLSGEGSLQVRESPKSYGTDKEKEMYSPATGDAGNWYSELAKLAAGRGVCIDLHMCTPPGAYCDLPTQATLSARTGGEMIVYPYFFPPTGQGSEPTQQRFAPINTINEEAQNRMNFDLACKLGREYGTEAVLKVRTSPGLRTHKYVGNFEDRADNEADLAGVDSEKSILVTLQHDGAEIKNGDDMFVQAALLFTNARGQRRVRIHNLKMVAADTVQSVFRHADVDAILSHMLRVSVQTTLTKDAKFVEKDLEDTSIEMLYAYRKHCATNSSQGQLILPESLKLLPLYISTVLKLQAFAVNVNRSGKTSHSKSPFGDVHVRVDARLVELVALSSISPGRVVPFLYPRMFRVDNLAAQYGIPVPLMQQQQLGGIDLDALSPPRPSSELSVDDLRILILPPVVYPSIEQINSNPSGMYLVDHRFGIFLVVGSTVDEDSFVQVFGGASANSATLPPNTPLVMYDSDLSKRIWGCISAIKQRRDNFYMPVSVISAIDVEGRELLKALMVEDKGKSGGKSYVEILCDIHTSIQAKLMST